MPHLPITTFTYNIVDKPSSKNIISTLDVGVDELRSWSEGKSPVFENQERLDEVALYLWPEPSTVHPEDLNRIDPVRLKTK